MKSSRIILILRIAVAVILIQTLRFKFTAHADSVYIFETIGLEPYGRIGIGVLELIAGILLLIPKTIWAGATLAAGLMAGAILMHLTQLGIEIKGDGGVLFYTAIITFVLSVIILYTQRKEIPVIGKQF
ncbi:DoxX family membrane protein [Winogradskyella sp. R77965]|uniref:DoxX family membrane protein n=1 Tax=Winogradskyella sp. R77965 TaxID=3093872 RepID=UPI0037DBF776